jgi:hypothetical protein
VPFEPDAAALPGYHEMARRSVSAVVGYRALACNVCVVILTTMLSVRQQAVTGDEDGGVRFVRKELIPSLKNPMSRNTLMDNLQYNSYLVAVE